MKKTIIFFLAVFSTFVFSDTASAQVGQASISLKGNFARFYRFDQYEDPHPAYGYVHNWPRLLGGGIRLNLGIHDSDYNPRTKNALTIGVNYNFVEGIDSYAYEDLVKGDLVVYEGEINFQRYIFGGYNTRGNMYLLAGLSGGMWVGTWDPSNLAEINPDFQYFERTEVMYINANAGLGFEVWAGFMYIFTEGKISPTLNHYVNNTTIWERSLRDQWSASVGFRIPFGGRQLPPPGF